MRAPVLSKGVGGGIHTDDVLLAYFDEIGETGAFVARGHPRFNTSPAFGYAGFVIPETAARGFAAEFARKKQQLFQDEIASATHPGRWERKGADLFRLSNFERHPQQFRVFNALVRRVKERGGNLFYYADEKPLGTPKQTGLDTEERETRAMQEALNRIARHAESCDSNVLVMIDQINEKTRAQRLPRMYGHILGRAAEHPEMRRIVEPPMHIDSVLSSNIQFADWVAACVNRCIDFQLIPDSRLEWVTGRAATGAVHGSFTHESKLHLWQRACDDLHHSHILRSDRLVHPSPAGQFVGDAAAAEAMRKVKAAAERNHGGYTG